MEKLFSELPDDIYLSAVNVPGTHDSCTAFCTMENMCRCQSLTVSQQLDMGIRLFDIRLYKSGNTFYLCHSLADCFTDSEKKLKLTFDNVLEAFRSFLKENPDETLIVSVKQDRGIMNRFFFPDFYEKYIAGNENEWYLKNENPTLAECRGKMVLMRRCKVFPWWKKDKACGLDFSHWKDQDGKRRVKPEAVILQGGVKDAELTAFVQDRYGLAPEVKWNRCALPFLERSVPNKAAFYVHFLSTAYRYSGKSLYETAEKVNDDFKKYELSKDSAQGWMLFDFPAKEMIYKVITSNFEIYKESKK